MKRLQADPQHCFFVFLILFSALCVSCFQILEFFVFACHSVCLSVEDCVYLVYGEISFEIGQRSADRQYLVLWIINTKVSIDVILLK